jgi:hypothetical protein
VFVFFSWKRLTNFTRVKSDPPLSYRVMGPLPPLCNYCPSQIPITAGALSAAVHRVARHSEAPEGPLLRSMAGVLRPAFEAACRSGLCSIHVPHGDHCLTVKLCRLRLSGDLMWGVFRGTIMSWRKNPRFEITPNIPIAKKKILRKIIIQYNPPVNPPIMSRGIGWGHCLKRWTPLCRDKVGGKCHHRMQYFSKQNSGCLCVIFAGFRDLRLS